MSNPQRSKTINSPEIRLPLIIVTFFILPVLAWMAGGHSQKLFLGCVPLCHLLVMFGLFWPNARLLHRPVCRFRSQGKDIWLTLDDGPDLENTLPLARELSRRGVRATFFLIGDRLAGASQIGAELESLGHEAGNHTRSHLIRRFWCLTPAHLKRNIDEASQLLIQSGVSRVRFFRSPVGMANLALAPVLNHLCLRSIGWSVRSFDGSACEPQAVIKRVLSKVFPGAILLMHEGKRDSSGKIRSPETIMAIVDQLQDRGYRFVLPEPETFL